MLNAHWKSSVGLVLQQGLAVSVDLTKPPGKALAGNAVAPQAQHQPRPARGRDGAVR
ncbi:hypothetical protein ACTMU2_00420 [Cupriavidus basilensis]